MSHADQTLVDFAAPDAVSGWIVINDGVMGGVSTSRLIARDGFASFEGIVSLENNGGFASTRTARSPGQGPSPFPDLSARHIEAFVIEARGDGKRYKLTLRTDDGFDAIQYQAAFEAPRRWSTIRLPTSAFQARFRGRPVPQAPPLDVHRVRAIGLLISDRQPGPFRLDVRGIRVSP
ncbi:MAG: CIA30 family protein [Burkholderiales bacterium]|nr:MAG: CIA30 family protein [Burkholderiales bacterium]